MGRGRMIYVDNTSLKAIEKVQKDLQNHSRRIITRAETIGIISSLVANPRIIIKRGKKRR